MLGDLLMFGDLPELVELMGDLFAAEMLGDLLAVFRLGDLLELVRFGDLPELGDFVRPVLGDTLEELAPVRTLLPE